MGTVPANVVEEFRAQVGGEADKIEDLIEAMEGTNEEMLGEIEDCRKEYFLLENQKK